MNRHAIHAIRALALLEFLAVISGCKHPESAETSPRATPVRVETLAARASASGVRYSATIEPLDQVSLAFNVGGYVTELARVSETGGTGERTIRIGDPVKRGQVLARLRDAEYQDRLRQAAAEVARAQSSLVKAEKDWARTQQLYASQSLTKPEHDTAEAALTAARAGAASVVARREEVERSLRDTTLVAPIDGVIVTRKIDVGALAAPGSVAFAIADLAHVKAVFGVPDTMLSALQVGATLNVTSEAVGSHPCAGVITAISPSADQASRVFDVEVDLANPDRALKSGMIASLAVPAGSDAPAPSGVLVPLAAVVRSKSHPEGYAVYVVVEREGGFAARLTDIEVERLVGNAITATAGVAAGERVVVSGTTLVTDGGLVDVVS